MGLVGSNLLCILTHTLLWTACGKLLQAHGSGQKEAEDCLKQYYPAFLLISLYGNLDQDGTAESSFLLLQRLS